MTDYWNSLVFSAIAGIDASGHLVNSLGAADSLVVQIDGPGREAALLAKAAIVALSNRAGHQPNTLPNRVELQLLSGRDSKPYCNQRVASMLDAMLSGTMEELIPEWLTLVNSNGRTIPPHMLPAVFDLGCRRESLRTAIAEASGTRGRWLAAHNPRWSWIAAKQRSILPEPDRVIEVWETGSADEREALLSELRKRDANRARLMLESTWKSDSPDQRIRFVKCLSFGLSIDDEPFLESALDDKRKEIRQQSRDLLGELPKARLCARMQQRAGGMIQLKRAFLRANSLVVQLPDRCDEAMIRDGMENNPARQLGFGEKAHWLCEIVGYVPLQFWTDTWEQQPAQIIETAMRCEEWRNAIIKGWNDASRRQKNAEWQEAMLSYFVSHPDKWGDASCMAYADLAAIPDAQTEALLLQALAQTVTDPRAVHPLVNVAHRAIIGIETTWSDELARQIVRIATVDMRRTSTVGKLEYSEVSLLTQAAYQSSPRLFEHFNAIWKDTKEQLHAESLAAVNRFLDIMQFRLNMQRAFEEETN